MSSAGDSCHHENGWPKSDEPSTQSSVRHGE